ncbi:MAG: GerMN domain-containing protein [Spirochaetia bacterium]|nr:GerMN domain-containing protein [Spirochaetia bacterium]
MAKTKRKSSRKKHNKTKPLGFLFWVALIACIIVVFMMVHDNMAKTFGNKCFMDIFKISREEPSLEIKSKEIPVPKEEKKEVKKNTVKPAKDNIVKIGEIVVPAGNDGVKPDVKVKQNVASSSRDSVLYFVSVADNGEIKLNKVNRKILFSTTPLEATIVALVNGITSAEDFNRGLISMIPDNTKVRSIRVENGTATIDFSEEFMFNTFGSEGLKTQIQQVVYTATEFPTVKNVQILIEGKRKQYIAEGVSIEMPISRETVF